MTQSRIHTIDDLRAKYPTKDIIQVTSHDGERILKSYGEEDDREIPLPQAGGFFRFIESGVILLTNVSHGGAGIPYFPFKFEGDDKVVISCIGNRPDLSTYTTGKLHVKRIGDTLSTTFEEVANSGIQSNIEFPGIQKFLPELVLCLNAFLANRRKENLYSAVTQTTRGEVSENRGGRRQTVRRIFTSQRYVVSLPENYRPRRIEGVEYITPEWERSAHITTRWVRVENAELLKSRHEGSRVLWETHRNGKVKLEFSMHNQQCHRRVRPVVPTDERTTRVYHV